MRELEIKARVTDETALRKQITKMGIQLGDVISQHDKVYSLPGAKEDPIAHNWLRIRAENGRKYIFTLKRSVSGQLDSIEHETEIKDPGAMEECLKLMGYELHNEIKKTRQKAYLAKEKIEICIDEVDGLGTYIELEKEANIDADNKTEENELWKILEKLGIERKHAETRGYDSMMKELQVRK